MNTSQVRTSEIWCHSNGKPSFLPHSPDHRFFRAQDRKLEMMFITTENNNHGGKKNDS